jgi:hypothetical protein
MEDIRRVHTDGARAIAVIIKALAALTRLPERSPARGFVSGMEMTGPGRHPLRTAPTVSATRAPRAPMDFGEPVVVSRAV